MKKNLFSLVVVLGLVLGVSFNALAQVTHLPGTGATQEANYLILKNNILADSSLDALRSIPDYQAIADIYNLPASPAFWVWRTSLDKMTIYRTTSPDSTTWSWTLYKAQTQAEQNSWLEMFAGTDNLNPSLANVRAGYSNIFGAGSAQTAFLNSVGRRGASRVEKLFADTSGGNTGTSAAPAILVYQGKIGNRDVAHAFSPSTSLD